MNPLLTVLRQYWKYKNRDIVMSLATFIIGVGLSLLSVKVLTSLLISFEKIPAEFTLNPNNISPLFPMALIVTGIVIGILRIKKLDSKLTGLLMIYRGMEGMNIQNAQKALPKSFSKGNLDTIDLLYGHQQNNGRSVSPELALDIINSIDHQISSRMNFRETSEVQMAFAGLAPIPLLTALGFKVSSRQDCLILDQNRNGSWHCIDDIDDLEKLHIEHPADEITTSVSLIVPFTVDIAKESLPLEHQNTTYILRLDKGARPSSLNSEDKQKRIAGELYVFLANLRAIHPKIVDIHIYAAYQASFAFRIGTIITSSVMPSCHFYQFDGNMGKYSWGVSFSSGDKPSLVYIS